MKRKLLAVLMAVVLLFGLTGCEGSIAEKANKLGVGSWLLGNDKDDAPIDSATFADYLHTYVFRPADPLVEPTAEEMELAREHILREIATGTSWVAHDYDEYTMTADLVNHQIIFQYESCLPYISDLNILDSLEEETQKKFAPKFGKLGRLFLCAGNEVDENGNPIGEVQWEQDEIIDWWIPNGESAQVYLSESGVASLIDYLQKQPEKKGVISLWLDHGAVWAQRANAPRYELIADAMVSKTRIDQFHSRNGFSFDNYYFDAEDYFDWAQYTKVSPLPFECTVEYSRELIGMSVE